MTSHGVDSSASCLAATGRITSAANLRHRAWNSRCSSLNPKSICPPSSPPATPAAPKLSSFRLTGQSAKRQSTPRPTWKAPVRLGHAQGGRQEAPLCSRSGRPPQTTPRRGRRDPGGARRNRRRRLPRARLVGWQRRVAGSRAAHRRRRAAARGGRGPWLPSLRDQEHHPRRRPRPCHGRRRGCPCRVPVDWWRRSAPSRPASSRTTIGPPGLPRQAWWPSPSAPRSWSPAATRSPTSPWTLWRPSPPPARPRPTESRSSRSGRRPRLAVFSPSRSADPILPRSLPKSTGFARS